MVKLPYLDRGRLDRWTEQSIASARESLSEARASLNDPADKLARLADVFAELQWATHCIDEIEKREQA